MTPQAAERARLKQVRRIINATKRAHAPGREERIAKAQAKRDRKAEKRAADAAASDAAQLRERRLKFLEGL